MAGLTVTVGVDVGVGVINEDVGVGVGVGGGATFAALIVLSAMNLPVALAGLLISIEPLIDMGRTAVNVSGSMTAGVLTGRVTGELDTTIYATRRGMTLPVDETNAVG